MLSYPSSRGLNVVYGQPRPALNNPFPVVSRVDAGNKRFNRQSRADKYRLTPQHIGVAMHECRALQVHSLTLDEKVRQAAR